jgi:hypothetical protein
VHRLRRPASKSLAGFVSPQSMQVFTALSSRRRTSSRGSTGRRTPPFERPSGSASTRECTTTPIRERMSCSSSGRSGVRAALIPLREFVGDRVEFGKRVGANRSRGRLRVAAGELCRVAAHVVPPRARDRDVRRCDACTNLRPSFHVRVERSRRWCDGVRARPRHGHFGREDRAFLRRPTGRRPRRDSR